MLGRAMLTCDIDERWNGPPPRCEIIECEALPDSIQNSHISTPNGTFFGSKAEISCPLGFKLDGPQFINCLPNGQWSHPITNCVKIEEYHTTVIPVTPRPRTSSRTPSKSTTTRYSTSATSPIPIISSFDGEFFLKLSPCILLKNNSAFIT